MAKKKPKPPAESKERAVYTAPDVLRLIAWVALNAHKAGDNMLFKQSEYNALADHMNEARTEGAEKSAKSVKDKWQAVRFSP